MASITIQASLARRIKINEAIVFIICLACIFLFLSSAYSKFAEHERFIHGLSRIPVISSLAPAISWIVPFIEVIVSLLLIIPKTLKTGLYLFTCVMAVFTLYIGIMLIWADKLPCHCNLFIEKLSWGQHLQFNLACILLAIIALRLSKSKH